MGEFQHEKLKALMKEKGITQYELAGMMHIKPNTLNSKLNGVRPFNTKEIMQICGILGISAKQMVHYFFPIKYKDKKETEE